jgi:hypothetical protein
MAKKVRERDTNKKAFQIVSIATGEGSENNTTDAIKAAAAALGRKGGLKGGPARAKALSSKKRSEIASKAAAARWGRKD